MAPTDSARDQRRRHEQAIDFLLRIQDADQQETAQRELEAWVASDAANARAYEEARTLLGDARSAILADPKLSALKPKRRTSTGRKATALALTIGTATAAFLAFDGPMRLHADDMSGTGEMPTITLADGSTMQLNANSAVSYEFSGTARIVHLLRGEAYFEVARDPQRAFVVEANGAHTTALGTAFNVRLTEAAADIVVTEHAVEVTSAGPSASAVRVEAGQEVACCTDGKVGTVRPVDTAAALAWRRGQLVVDNARLEDVVTEIRRHYSGRIVITSDDIAQRRVSGTFTVSDPDAALELLSQSLGLTITRLGPLVLIRG